jgi:hypothetical protein
MTNENGGRAKKIAYSPVCLLNYGAKRSLTRVPDPALLFDLKNQRMPRLFVQRDSITITSLVAMNYRITKVEKVFTSNILPY